MSLVVPVFDELPVLPQLLEGLRSVAGRGVEVVMVDNGSSDGSSEVLAGSGFRVVKVPVNRGFGFGVRAGLRVASGSVVVWMPGNGRVVPEDAARAGLVLLGAGTDAFLKARRSGRPVRLRVRSLAAAVLVSSVCGRLVAEPGSTPSGVFRTDVGLLLDGPDGLAFEAWSWWRLRSAGRSPVRPVVRFDERPAGSSKWASGRLSGVRFASGLVAGAVRWRRGVW